MDQLLVIRVSYEKSYLNNYSEQLFCQAIKKLFQFLFQSKQIFLTIYENIVLIFSLVRATFLSSYKIIILIFSLLITVFLPSYKNIFSSFSLVKTAFLTSDNYKCYHNFFSNKNSFFVALQNFISLFDLNCTAFFSFCFSLNKVAAGKYSPRNFKSLKISIGAIIKNPKIVVSNKICS